jgi:hypothetical protein
VHRVPAVKLQCSCFVVWCHPQLFVFDTAAVNILPPPHLLHLCHPLRCSYTWEIYAKRLLTLSSVYSFWKRVSNLDRAETKRYLEMLYVLRLRPLIEKVPGVTLSFGYMQPVVFGVRGFSGLLLISLLVHLLPWCICAWLVQFQQTVL